MVDWVHRYGVLGYDREAPGQPENPQHASTFSQAVGQAAGVLALYEAVLNGDGERAKSAILEEFPLVGVLWGLYNDELYKSPDIDRESIAQEISASVEHSFGGDYLEYALQTAADDVWYMASQYCNPALSVEAGSRDPSGVTAYWNFTSLLGAMYLQMYWLMAAGGNVTRCRYCRRIIALSSPLPGTRKIRQDKKFCNDACRQRHHYHTKTKPRRQGKHS